MSSPYSTGTYTHKVTKCLIIEPWRPYKCICTCCCYLRESLWLIVVEERNLHFIGSCVDFLHSHGPNASLVLICAILPLDPSDVSLLHMCGITRTGPQTISENLTAMAGSGNDCYSQHNLHEPCSLSVSRAHAEDKTLKFSPARELLETR